MTENDAAHDRRSGVAGYAATLLVHTIRAPRSLIKSGRALIKALKKDAKHGWRVEGGGEGAKVYKPGSALLRGALRYVRNIPPRGPTCPARCLAMAAMPADAGRIDLALLWPGWPKRRRRERCGCEETRDGGLLKNTNKNTKKLQGEQGGKLLPHAGASGEYGGGELWGL